MANNKFIISKGFKLFILIFSNVLVLSSIFYILIFSVSLANSKIAINIRTNYISTAFKVRGLLGLEDTDNYGYLKSPIRVINKLENNEFGYKYIYTVVGKLVFVNPFTGTITLKSSDNKEYIVSIKMDPVELENGWYAVNGVLLGKDTKGATFYFYPEDLSQSVIKDEGFGDGQQYYTVYWRDSRTLSQILKGYRQNPKQSINLYPNGLMFVAR